MPPIKTLLVAACAWHFKHRLALRAVSIFALTVPCGLWQVVQPSRSASCSKANGPRWL
jgi:hypothetical protein